VNITVRAIQTGDWSAIDEIQRQAYPQALHEDIKVLQQKQSLAPESCWVAVDNEDRVCGYLLAHRWHDVNQVPALDTELASAEGSVLYIHDMALAINVQGLGLSMALWQMLIAYAREHLLQTMSLVAVNDSHAYWRHKGFIAQGQLNGDKGYGNNAVLMATTF
jgi:ribosomal protein S18 acetylase RimI-like enzyme